MGDEENFYVTIDNETSKKILERFDVTRAESLIQKKCLYNKKYNLDEIISMYWDEFKNEIFSYKRSDIIRICQTAIENLIQSGKIKVDSSDGYYINVISTRQISEESK